MRIDGGLDVTMLGAGRAVIRGDTDPCVAELRDVAMFTTGGRHRDQP
jgi:hypothetical protein